MGRHATIGNSNVGHKNGTLKQGAKHYANARVYGAAEMASEVKIEHFTPMIFPELPRKTAFDGINPVYGADFTQTGTNVYKLRVKDSNGYDCYVGLTRVT